MKKYKLWDKKEKIYTLGRDAQTGKMVWDASEYIEQRAPWAAGPDVKVVVAQGAVNGMVFMGLESMKKTYESMGLEIPDSVTDEQALQLIEDFEALNNMPDNTPSAQERIAAAMEYQNLLTMDEEENA